MMINTTDLKGGVTFVHYGKPYQVVKYNLVKMGRGSATVRINARNLETGGNEEISYQSNASVEAADTTKKKLQYLYKDAVTAFFMDSVNFEQIEITLKVLGNQILYIKEGEEVTVLFWNKDKGETTVALSVDLAPNVVLEVMETDPGVKGNSVSNLYKPATLENGLQVKVPLFINKGEKIRVDTRTGDYVERAKSQE